MENSILCKLRGGECYNPTCMLNGKCVDFINRENYIEWKEKQYADQISAIHRLRIMDAASSIAEANELRAKIQHLESKQEKLVGALKLADELMDICSKILTQIENVVVDNETFQNIDSLSKSGFEIAKKYKALKEAL